jgi:hypothetical protein
VLLRGVEVSYFHSVIEIARNLHSYFYGVQSIGWDITVTPEGPIFIEGNDDWGDVLPDVQRELQGQSSVDVFNDMMS